MRESMLSVGQSGDHRGVPLVAFRDVSFSGFLPSLSHDQISCDCAFQLHPPA